MRISSLLRWSENIFKVDMTYISQGGLWTSLRFLTGIAASVATMVAFGNLLPRENYGIYTYLLSLGSSLGFFTLTGIGPAVTRIVAVGQENALRYALRLQLKYNLLAIATIGAAALYYYAKGNALFGISLAILALVIPLEAAYHIYEHILIGRKKFQTLALLTSVSTLGAAIATIVALSLTDNVLTLISVYAVMSLVPSFVIYRWIAKTLPKEKPQENEINELRRSAFHITGAGLIGAIAQYVDKIILFQVAGPASLAVYGFAIAGPERLKGLFKNWVAIILPKLAERSLEEIGAVFYKRVLMSMGIGAAIAFLYILLSPLLFKWLLPKYLDSIYYSQVYALGLIIIPVLIYIGNIFYSQNMLRAIYITSTGNQILRIAILVIFGFLWQTWGLVIGFLVSQILSTIFCIAIWESERARLSKKAS